MLETVRELPGDLIPQAIIDRPIASLVEGRGRLARETDDLDDYEGASFILDGNLPFAIRHYRGYPENTSTIYLERSNLDVEQITTIIYRIIREFRLPEDAICWQRRDDPDL